MHVTSSIRTSGRRGRPRCTRPAIARATFVAPITGLVQRGLPRLPDVRIELVTCNSGPALLVYSGDRLDIVIAVDVVDGKIANFYAIRNPEKLATATMPRKITR